MVYQSIQIYLNEPFLTLPPNRRAIGTPSHPSGHLHRRSRLHHPSPPETPIVPPPWSPPARLTSGSLLPRARAPSASSSPQKRWRLGHHCACLKLECSPPPTCTILSNFHATSSTHISPPPPPPHFIHHLLARSLNHSLRSARRVICIMNQSKFAVANSPLQYDNDGNVSTRNRDILAAGGENPLSAYEQRLEKLRLEDEADSRRRAREAAVAVGDETGAKICRWNSTQW